MGSVVDDALRAYGCAQPATVSGLEWVTLDAVEAVGAKAKRGGLSPGWIINTLRNRSATGSIMAEQVEVKPTTDAAKLCDAVNALWTRVGRPILEEPKAGQLLRSRRFARFPVSAVISAAQYWFEDNPDSAAPKWVEIGNALWDGSNESRGVITRAVTVRMRGTLADASRASLAAHARRECEAKDAIVELLAHDADNELAGWALDNFEGFVTDGINWRGHARRQIASYDEDGRPASRWSRFYGAAAAERMAYRVLRWLPDVIPLYGPEAIKYRREIVDAIVRDSGDYPAGHIDASQWLGEDEDAIDASYSRPADHFPLLG